MMQTYSIGYQCHGRKLMRGYGACSPNNFIWAMPLIMVTTRCLVCVDNGSLIHDRSVGATARESGHRVSLPFTQYKIVLPSDRHVCQQLARKHYVKCNLSYESDALIKTVQLSKE